MKVPKMNKLLAAALTLYTLLIIFLVVFIMQACYKPKPGEEIIKKEIVYNTIEKDPLIMPLSEIQYNLNCFYKSAPRLDIDKYKGEYIITAGLCDRAWSRKVSIRPRDSPNIIIINMVINSRLIPGVSAHYYHMINDFMGFGGGLTLLQNLELQASGGVAFKF